MTSVDDYLSQLVEKKKVWIIGVGREGISSYSLLRRHLPQVEITLIDDKPLDELPTEVSAFSQDHQTTFSQSAELPDAAYFHEILAFKTPGIPSSHQVIAKLLNKNAQITSNTQVFFDLIATLPAPPTTIGVTGTKGKSTTTSMIYHVLKENGKTAFLAGNIGTPPLNLVEEIFSLEKPEHAQVVLELSSHQLRELTVSPDIAVIQNITPEHLDYYPTFEEYQKAKQAITRYQKVNNAVIFCPKFDTVVNLLSDLSQRYTYDVEPADPSSLTAYATTDGLYVGSDKVIDLSELPLVGKHNLYNTLPSVIVGKLLGLELSQIANSLKTFKPLPHRLEYVDTVNQVQYFNDSQATTPEAAIAAIDSFSQPLHLIAGGSDKGVDLSGFANHIVTSKIKTLILFPPMGAVIADLVQKAAETHHQSAPTIIPVTSMAEAVTQAHTHAKPGEVVLLSPACASFGIFKNYQDRGDQFKKRVLEVER